MLRRGLEKIYNQESGVHMGITVMKMMTYLGIPISVRVYINSSYI